MSFSRRDLFWYAAGALSVLVVLFLVHALNGNQNSAVAQANAHAAMMPSDAAAASDATPSPAGPADTAGAARTSPQGAGSMDEVLSRLEERLATRGGSDADWELLAQTYEFVGRNDDAKLARQHRLPEGAASADGSTHSAPDASAGPAGTPLMPAADTHATDAAVSGEVELSSTLRSKIPDGLTLFVIAKSVDSPGPPLAILRTTTGHWPLQFRLDDSNAMLPGRNLSSAQHVTIEARVSRSGGAAPQSGDYQSPVTAIDPHGSHAVHVVLDHVIG
jgi:hypothetical protein